MYETDVRDKGSEPVVKVPLPPVAVAVRFIDCVNRSDLDGLVATMTDDHRLEVFDDEPLIGREANATAWRGYFESFPNYIIYPHRIVEVTETSVAILGHTATGVTSDPGPDVVGTAITGATGPGILFSP